MIEILGILGTAVLAELLFKGAVVLVAASALAWTLKGASAATRHAVWTTSLALLILLPLGMRLAPNWWVPSRYCPHIGPRCPSPGASCAR